MDAERQRAVIGSVMVHLVLVGIVAFTMWERPKPPAVALNQPIIQARAVDEATAMEPVRRREAEEQRKKEAAEQQRREAEATKKRQAEEQQKKLEAEKQKKAAELQKKAEAEKQRQSELKRKQEAAKVEEEKKQLAEEKRKKAEAEKKRKEEEEAKRKAGEEKLKQAMAAEAERIDAEERQYRAQQRTGWVNQYMADITSRIRGSWRRQPGMPPDFVCKVRVKQLESGVVTDVRIIESCGNIMLDRSVEAAVWKSSPLPAPPSPDIFDREVIITFVPR